MQQKMILFGNFSSHGTLEKSELAPYICCFPCLFVLFSLSVKYPFFLSPSLSQTYSHNGRNPNISPSPSHISFSVNSVFLYCFSLCCPYLLLNLPSFSVPKPFSHHTRLFHQVSLDVYIIEASCSRLHRDRVKVTCLCITPSFHPTLPKHSLTLYCLWSCFIMSSYMHIIEACPTQAAWLRWNIWIIYHLQSALPHFRKFSQQSRKIIHVIRISRKGGASRAKTERTKLVRTGLCHICFTLIFSLPVSLIFSCLHLSVCFVPSSLKSYKYCMFILHCSHTSAA